MESAPSTDIRISRFEACLVCRRRKLRCDAAQPECNRCHTTGATCQYQDPQYRSRIRVLQDRIKEIEAKINEIEQRPRRSNPRSGVSASPKSEESILDSNILSRPLSPQTSSPVFPPSHSKSQVTDPSPCSTLGASCLNSNVLSRRGPSSLSIPGDVSKKLLNMFMQRRLVSGFELHIGRVLRSFQPASSEAGVPALFNAMLLIGCHFISEPELSFWENMCYERTKWEIEANVGRAHLSDKSKYNPLHHLQAMIMLGQWFYLKGRLLEGHVYITRTMRFAVALGLHELDSRIYGHYVVAKQATPYRGLERWSPRDPIELGEAINLWWACLTRDLSGNLVNGLPPSISLGEIKTVWPVALSGFEDMGGSELSDDNSSIASLFDSKLVHIFTDVSQDTVNSILAKSTILAYCAGKLDTERISGSEVSNEWWERFEECDRGTRSFTQFTEKVCGSYDVEEAAHIALAHAAVNCATIQLHGSLADYELDIGARGDTRGLLYDNTLGGYSYARCMEACRNIALVTAFIEGIDTSYMHMFFGVSWSCAAKVLAKQIPRLRQNGYTERAQEMEQQISLMVKNMERLLVTYPILALQAEHMQTLLS